jgi:hypothetical protein
MSNRRYAVVAVLAFVLLALALASASITGSISGVVTDKSGAVVAGASVTATDTLTGVQTTQKTDTKGFYNLPTLAVGTYDLEIKQVGFKTYRQTGLVIDANSALRADASLAIGSINEKIEVSTEAAQVETQSTQMGEVIEGTKMTSVPLNGRSFIDLLSLQPGVSPYKNTDQMTNGIGSDPTTVSGDQTNGSQSVNGGRTGSNGFMVNGADAQEGVHNGAAIIPNLDSIYEFRILTNNFDAEYGNFSGGQINVVTKSGTNRFHGSAFDFLRNTDFDAANFFAGGARGDFKQNQFGGTIGGPIKKDKVFFFADYQGNRQILGQTQSFAVPTAADRLGNLSDEASTFASGTDPNGNPIANSVVGTNWAAVLASRLGSGYTVNSGEPYYFTAGMVDPRTINPQTGLGTQFTSNCTTSDPTTGCVFPNASIPTTAWDPVATATLKYIPAPNANLPSGANYEASSFNQHLRDDKFGIRLDTTTPYGTLFGYYFFDQFSVTTPYAQGITFPGFDSSVQGRAQMINLGLTTTINNSTINDVRLVYLRDRYFGGIPIGGTGVSLTSLGFEAPSGTGPNFNGGIAPITPALAGVPSFVFNNYNFGLPQDALRQFNNTYQIIDNFTKIAGTHTLQFGVDFHYDQINERNYDDANGAYTFDGSETGLDFADYLIGAPVNFTQASQQLLDSRDKYFGVYAQDSWRAKPTLTINYGLRYEVMTPWYDTQNKLETVIPGEQSKTFPTAPVGLVVPGDPGVPRTLAPIQYHNFAPRIGFAYAPDATEGLLGKVFGGPGKSSIRVGYGIFYSAIEDATGFVEVGDAPYGLYYSSPEPTLLATPFIDRATGLNRGQKFPFTFPPSNASPKNPDTSFNWVQATPISGADYLDPHDKIPQVQQFEFSLQRQLGSSTVISASYVGSVGRHLLTFEESNPANASLCNVLSNPANLAAGQTPCGPFGEDNSYILASGVTVNSPTAVTSNGVTTVNGTRPTFGANFGSNPYMATVVSSSFNSLQVSVKHNEKYANFLVAYTYEKSIDNGSTSFDATNPFNSRQSRALSIFDVPQDLTVSYTVQLPFDKLTGGSFKRLTSGWALSGITTFAKGEPVQLSESDDNSLSGTFADTIDVPSYANNGSHLFANRNPRNPAGQPYFNPNYFTFEPVGQVGNVMRRYFSGPGINNFDMALLKDTKLTESTQVQFRAETFNIFNHAQFMNPSGNINNTGQGGFGFVTQARDPRIMQLALKFLF